MITGVTGTTEGQEKYVVDVSDLDMDRQFEEAGRALGHGHSLHQMYRKAHASRDGHAVNLEAILVAASATARAAIESKSKTKFENLFDANRPAISKLQEQARAGYDKLKSASFLPEGIPWRFKDTIDFRRDPTETLWDNHLYVETDGTLGTTLTS